MPMLANVVETSKEQSEKPHMEESQKQKNSDGYRALFKNRNFLSLWLGQIFSQLGDRVTFVVFVAVIAASFGTSTSLQSYLYISFTIPAILLTTIAGVFVDRWNKKYTLMTTNVLRAVLILILPAFNTSLFSLYALAFMVSAVTQFFVPAEASAIPSMVKKNQLITANSLFTTTMMGSLIFGFILGDPLINIFGLKYVHWGVFGLFIISTCLLSFIKYKPAESESHSDKSFKDFIEELKQGFIYIKNNKKVLQALLKLAALFSIIVMLSILAIGISQQKLYPDNPALGAQKFAYIIAFSGVGMVIGSIIVGKLLRNVNKYLLTYSGFTVIGFTLILLTLVGLIPKNLSINIPGYSFYNVNLEEIHLTFRMIFTYAVAALTGFGCSLVSIPVQTIIQSSVAEDVRGKVFGVQFTLLSTSSTLPVLIAALGADTIGIIKMLIIIGVPVLILGIWGLTGRKN